MAKRKSSTQQTRNPSSFVPRHVANLNRTAEKAGLKTSVRTGEVPQEWPVKTCDGEVYDWARGAVVLSTWSGTKAQLLAMGILCNSYHFPQRVGWICEPRYGPWSVGYRHPILCGVIKVSGDDVSLELYGGPRPDSIRMAGDAETVQYANEIAHHGTAGALIAQGICTERELSLKRFHQTRGGDSPEHMIRKLPDGTFIHWRETEEAYRLRITAERERDAQEASAAKGHSQQGTGYQTLDALREQAASAAVDPAFQRFIERVMGTPPNAAAGA